MMLMNDRFLQMLGLARKAGILVLGEESCIESIKKNKIKLCIIACDVSNNTKKRMTDKCTNKKIEYLFYGTKESIGSCLGKDVVAVVCIKNEGFAVQLRLLWEQNKSFT